MDVRARQRGFSMIELVVVIVILGVVATIAIPRMSNAAESARSNAVTAQLNQYRRAFEVYHAENLAWPPESATGVAPLVMDAYLDREAFARNTPIGGKWDWQNNGGNDVEIRIVSFQGNGSTVQRVNSEFDDDNDLSDGRVQVDAGSIIFKIGR